MAQVKEGQNIIMAQRLFMEPLQQQDLVIEIRNSNFKFRFLTSFLNPDSDEIDVVAITTRRPGNADDTRLLQGGPVNIKQITNEGRQGNGPFLLESLDQSVRDTDVVFTLRNNDPDQGVVATISLIGVFATIPARPEDRGELDISQQMQPIRRQVVDPQQGPLQGIRMEGPHTTRYY